MVLDAISEFLTRSYWGNTVEEYIVAVLILLTLNIILRIFKFTAIKKLRNYSGKTKTEVDGMAINILDTFGWPFYSIVSLQIAILYIDTANWLSNVVYYALIILLTWYGVRAINKAVTFSSTKLVKQRAKQGEKDSSIIDLLSRIIRGIVWLLALLFLLSNFGVEITPLIAGMSIGGLAIAFALQNILGDIFASFSIYFDKPFEVGDFIIIGSDMGVVEDIGIKSTRIKALQGHLLIVSNKELTEARINNYKQLEKRRIVFGFGVTYETPVKKMKKINEIVKKVFENEELAELDRVHFKEFGDFSLDYEVVYYANTQDYTKYMDIQESINLAIKEKFEKEGIEMAFPTQTIYTPDLEKKS